MVRPGVGQQDAHSEVHAVHGTPSKFSIKRGFFSSASDAAASANRAKAGRDLAPVFFMIEVR
jgi:hypothetical protein